MRERRVGLGPLSATLLVAGNMIGSGAYLLPATLAVYGSASLIGWALGAAGAMTLAFVYARLARLEPDPDGIVGYPKRRLGRLFGFQAGTLYWIGCWVGNAALAVAAAGYLAVFLPELKTTPWLTTAAALGFVALTGLVAWLGARAVAITAAGGLILGLAPVAVAAVAGWARFDPAVFVASWNPSGAPLHQLLPPVLVSVFWAFLGLEAATVAAASVRDPARNVPIAVISGVGVAALVYILAVAAVMGVIPAAELQRSTAPFADVAGRLLGPNAALVVAACALLKIVGALAGWMLCTAQTSRSAAAEGLFPKACSSVAADRPPRRDVLVGGVLTAASVIAAASPTVGQSFGVLINVTTLLFLALYVLSALALLRMDPSFGGRAAALVGVGFCAFAAVMAPRGDLAVAAALVVALCVIWLFVRGRIAPQTASGSIA